LSRYINVTYSKLVPGRCSYIVLWAVGMEAIGSKTNSKTFRFNYC